MTWLIDLPGNSLAPSFYLMITALITLAVVATLKERKGEPLPAGSWCTDAIADPAGQR